MLIATLLPLAGGRAGDEAGPQIEVTLQLDKPTYEVGEAIPVSLEIINRGANEYSVLTSTEPTGERDGIAFTITDAAGTLLPRPLTLPKADTWLGSWLVVRPHEKCERSLFLNHWFLSPMPGRFAVQASYLPRDNREWPAVQSPRIEFEIVPTTSTKLEVRIARLTEQSERGDQIAIDFLGFTGENAAIAPLVAALYSDDFHIQRRAAGALNLINDQNAAIAALLAKVQELGPTAMAAEWLAAVHTSTSVLVPIYLRAMNATDSTARLGAITGLRLALPTALADKKFATQTRWAIRHALNDRDARVRYEAVLAMRLYSEKQTLAILKEIARTDRTARVRNAAAAVLLEIEAGKN